jgi:Cytochrome c7 and related cytochrome c
MSADLQWHDELLSGASKPFSSSLTRLIFILLVLITVPAGAAKKNTVEPPKPTNAECLACHSDPNLTTKSDGKEVSLAINETHFNGSIHSMFACVDCHTDVKTSMHEGTPAKPTCAQCHSEQQTAYDRSFHAQARKNGDAHAATCMDCHGNVHEILASADSASKVNHANVAATCGACPGRNS